MTKVAVRGPVPPGALQAGTGRPAHRSAKGFGVSELGCCPLGSGERHGIRAGGDPIRTLREAQGPAGGEQAGGGGEMASVTPGPKL